MLVSVTSRSDSMINYLLTYTILIGSLLASDSPKSSVLRTEYGFIDYANRVIVSRGMANISQKNSSTDELQVIEKNLKFSKNKDLIISAANGLTLHSKAPSLLG